MVGRARGGRFSKTAHVRSALRAAGRPSQALRSELEPIAGRSRTDEVIRYEAALRGNAAYLSSLDAPTRMGVRLAVIAGQGPGARDLRACDGQMTRPGQQTG